MRGENRVDFSLKIVLNHGGGEGRCVDRVFDLI